MNFNQNLIKEHPYKIELHCHSSGASDCSQITPTEMITTYKFEGYSGLVITNHFYPFKPSKLGYKKYVDNYINEFKTLAEKGEAHGIKVYLGMEIRFEENENDYLVYGIDEDFIRNAISQKMKTLSDFVSVAKNEKNIILQAHPFRTGMKLMPPELLDGIEVYNLHPNHNSRVGFAAKYAEEIGGVFTCGTDYHHTGQGALTALLTRELPKDSFDLVNYIKNEPIYKIGNSIVTF